VRIRRTQEGGKEQTEPEAVLVGVLESAGVRISMDGRGRWMDNVMVERLWRVLAVPF
jgi:hypothetical protein